MLTSYDPRMSATGSLPVFDFSAESRFRLAERTRLPFRLQSPC